MSSCAVIKCSYKFQNNDHVIFHRFPDNPTLLRRWIIALKDEELRKNEELFLCPDHIKLIEHNGSTSPMDSDGFSLMKNKPKIEMATLDMIDYDFNKTCRMCLFSNNVSNQQMITIFKSGSSKISIDGELKLLKFKISPNDGLPQQICSDCMNCLININNFRVKGVESQTILEHYFKHSLVNVLPPQQQQQQLMTDEIVWIKTEMNDVDKLDQLPLNEKPYDDYNDYSDLLQTYDSDNEIGIQNDFKKTDIVINSENHSKSNDLKKCNTNDLECLCKFCLKHLINIELGDYQHQPTDECKLDTINEIKCLHCDLNCMNIGDYIKHTNAIHPGLLCWICKEFYLDTTDLTIHLNSQHGDEKESHKRNAHSNTENVCQICFLKFEDKHKLKHHENYHHPLNTEKKFGCNFCDKSFLYNDHLKTHEKTHVKSYRYKCSICGQRFANVIQYSDHIKYLHKDEFKMLQCDYCDKEYISRSSLRKHIHCNHKNECSSEIIHCDECNSSFTTRDGYEIHKKTHTNSEIHRYKCDICGHTFKSNHFVRRHITVQHSTNSNRSSLRNTNKIEKQQHTNVKPNNEIDQSERKSKWLCKFCGKHYVTGNRTDYQQPIDKCNLEKEPNCRNCVEQFNNIDDYIKHVNTKHSPGYTCSICNVNCFEKSTLAIHLATHAVEECVLKCDECNRGFKTRKTLLYHKKRMHIVSEHLCHICSLKFDNYVKFKLHMKKHNRIKCSHCDKTFSHQYTFKQHAQTHSGELTHLCNICGIAFTNTTSLSSHMKQHKDVSVNSTQSERNIYPCKFCDKVYTVYSSWYHHERNYHPKGIAAKSYQCDKCDRHYITKKAFEYHIKSHDDVERKHKCQECPMAFKRNAHLQNHVLGIHLKEKPYKCLFCKKAFVQNGDLNIHMRVHNGEKPHTCKYCNESFRLQWDKNTHERTAHTGEKPSQCPRCDMAFINNRQLQTHLRKHMRNHETI